MTAENERLREARENGAPWRKWGPYLRDRQWADPREQLRREQHGALTYEQARAWAYEWGEDGLAGLCDEQMRLCFSIAVWNGRDRVLKERLSAPPRGVLGAGGECFTEQYVRSDNLPTHAYMRAAYRYAQRLALRREPGAPYFDVTIEYAKAAPEDILIQVTVCNRGPAPAPLHVLPHLWFRNAWQGLPSGSRPLIERMEGRLGEECLIARHRELGDYYLHCEPPGVFLFTDNETNTAVLFGGAETSEYAKDGIAERVVFGRKHAVNAAGRGTRAAAHFALIVAPGRTQYLRLRLTARAPRSRARSFAGFDDLLQARRRDAAEFYSVLTYACANPEAAGMLRRAWSESLWNKSVRLSGVRAWVIDRAAHRDCARVTLKIARVMATPEKWRRSQPPAGAFLLHVLSLACVDPDFAAEQLGVLLSGEPVCEEAEESASLTAANNPSELNAWGALLMYRLLRPRRPQDALQILHGYFNALSMSAPRAAWAIVHLQCMLEIALELSAHDIGFEQQAIELYTRYVTTIAARDHIARSASANGGAQDKASAQDDVLQLAIGSNMQLQVASPLGMLALCAAAVFPEALLGRLPRFCDHVRWLHREHAAVICSRDTARRALERLLAPSRHGAWSTLPGSMLFVRSLLQLDGLHGPALRAEPLTPYGARMTFAQTSAWAVMQLTSTPGLARGDGELAAFCEYVYMQGAVSAGPHTGWAGRVAPVICAACRYRPFGPAVGGAPLTAHRRESASARSARVVALPRTNRWT